MIVMCQWAVAYDLGMVWRTDECNLIKMEEMLRQQNYQLKNEITDLKNAFDLNRDILKILSSYNARSDPHHHLLLQIITRLTTVNNQSMLSSIQLIQEKNVLKQENLRLNLQLKALQERLGREIEGNKQINQPSESKLLMHEQFNSLSRELLAANEERIAREQEIEYWKGKYANALRGEQSSLERSTFETTTKAKIKRKYESNGTLKLEVLLQEAQRDNRRLKQYADELEQRLFVLIKAFHVREESLNRQRRSKDESFQTERQEIRLLKYALNSINIERNAQNDYVLSVTERFREKDQMNNVYTKDHRSASWPKNHIPRREDSEEEMELQFGRELEPREQAQY